jgi:hypothetical protein
MIETRNAPKSFKSKLTSARNKFSIPAQAAAVDEVTVRVEKWEFG